MDTNDVAGVLCRLRNLSGEEATRQACALFAIVRGRHPRLRVVGIAIDGDTTIVGLRNGVQAKFDPSAPVPIWRYPEGMQRGNPNSLRRPMSELELLGYLWCRVDNTAGDPEARRGAQAQLDKMMSAHNCTTIHGLYELLNVEDDARES